MTGCPLRKPAPDFAKQGAAVWRRAEGYAVAAGVGGLGTRGDVVGRIIGKEQEAETAKLAGMAEWLNG